MGEHFRVSSRQEQLVPYYSYIRLHYILRRKIRGRTHEVVLHQKHDTDFKETPE